MARLGRAQPRRQQGRRRYDQQVLQLTTVGKSLAVPYGIAGTTGKSAALPYAVKAPVGKSDALPYAVKKIVGKSDATPYAVKAPVGKSAGLPYGVAGSVGKSVALPYGLLADSTAYDDFNRSDESPVTGWTEGGASFGVESEAATVLGGPPSQLAGMSLDGSAYSSGPVVAKIICELPEDGTPVFGQGPSIMLSRNANRIIFAQDEGDFAGVMRMERGTVFPFVSVQDDFDRADTTDDLGTSPMAGGWLENGAFKIKDGKVARDANLTATATCAYLGSSGDWPLDQAVAVTITSDLPATVGGVNAHRGVTVRNANAHVGDENYLGCVERDAGDGLAYLKVYWAGPAGFPYLSLSTPVQVDDPVAGDARIGLAVTGDSPPRLCLWYDPDGSGFPTEPQIDCEHDIVGSDFWYTDGPPGISAYQLDSDEECFDDFCVGDATLSPVVVVHLDERPEGLPGIEIQDHGMVVVPEPTVPYFIQIDDDGASFSQDGTTWIYANGTNSTGDPGYTPGGSDDPGIGVATWQLPDDTRVFDYIAASVLSEEASFPQTGALEDPTDPGGNGNNVNPLDGWNCVYPSNAGSWQRLDDGSGNGVYGVGDVTNELSNLVLVTAAAWQGIDYTSPPTSFTPGPTFESCEVWASFIYAGVTTASPISGDGGHQCGAFVSLHLDPLDPESAYPQDEGVFGGWDPVAGLLVLFYQDYYQAQPYAVSTAAFTPPTVDYAVGLFAHPGPNIDGSYTVDLYYAPTIGGFLGGVPDWEDTPRLTFDYTPTDYSGDGSVVGRTNGVPGYIGIASHGIPSGTAVISQVGGGARVGSGTTSVGSSCGLPYAVKVAVGKSDALPYKVRALVGKSDAVPYGVRALTGKSDALPYAVKKIVGKSDALPYVLRQLAGKSDAFPYAMRALAGKSDAFPYGIVAPVGKSDALPYGVAGLVGHSLAAPYRVEIAVGKSDAFPYLVRVAVGKSEALPYAVRQLAGKSDAFPYAMVAHVGKSLVEPYQVRNVVGRSDALPYVVRAPVGKSDALPYVLRQLAGKSDAFPYGLAGIIGKSLVMPFSDRVTIGKSDALPYLLRALVGRSDALPYVLRNLAGKSAAFPYGVRAFSGKSLAMPWADRASVGRSDALPYTVRVTVGKSDALPFLLRHLAGKSTALPYGVAGIIGHSLVLPWGDKAAVGKSDALPYAVRFNVGRSLVELYALRQLAGRSDALAYAVRHLMANGVSLPYIVRALAGRSLIQPYQKLGITGKSLVVQYLLRSLVGRSDALAYAVAAHVGRSLVLAYHLESHIGKSAALPYNLVPEFLPAGRSLVMDWAMAGEIGHSLLMLYLVTAPVDAARPSVAVPWSNESRALPMFSGTRATPPS